MDGFWAWLDSVQKSGIYAAFQKFSSVDWVVFFSALWGMAIGCRKGASEMFARFFALFLSGVIILTFYYTVSDSIRTVVPVLPEEVSQPLAFLLLTGFTFISVMGCVNLIGKFLHVEAHGALKTFGGAFLGVAYFLFLVSLVIQFLLFIPSEGIRQNFQSGRTYSGAFLAGLFPKAQKIVVAPFFRASSKSHAPR